MKLTREMIFDGRTKRGGWNKHQLQLIGIQWPPERGWIERSIGFEITQEQFDEFKRLGTIRLRDRRK